MSANVSPNDNRQGIAMAATNKALDTLLRELDEVYSAVPPEGVIEPMVIGGHPSAKLLAVDLQLLVAFGALAEGRKTDGYGKDWRAYFRGVSTVEDLKTQIRTAYEELPEEGWLDEETYFWAEEDGSFKKLIKNTLRDVNVISYVYTDEAGSRVSWRRGDSGSVNLSKTYYDD